MMKHWMAGSALFIASACAAVAQTPWQKIQQAIAGPVQPIGSYANGCIIGAQALPLEAQHYQVMRQDQHRYFGHPLLIQFIQRFSQDIAQQTSGTVLIGDMGMPAGGRFSSGHASHQIGLDVDIWLQLPRQRWTPQQLLHPQPLDLVTADDKSVVSRLWSRDIDTMVRQAAEDPQVARIFVNPAIKQQLCLDAGSDRQWLQKVRPWFAHRAHMHVRLHCPANDTQCVEQAPPPAGDGCGAELQSWFEPPKPGVHPVKPKPPVLPANCQALLDKHLL